MEEKSAEQTDEDQRLHSSIHIPTLNNMSEQLVCSNTMSQKFNCIQLDFAASMSFCSF